MKERKFTNEEIKEIRLFIVSGVKTSTIIKKYSTETRKVNRMDISNIKNMKYYKDVK